MTARLMLTAAICVALVAAHAAAVEFTYPDGSTATATFQLSGQGYTPCDPSVDQYSGYLTINATKNKDYFFWAFAPRNQNNTAPVILWMTGGPGCSSSLALLVENGPCHVDLTSGGLKPNPYAWNNNAYIIYIDQPAGVGFSHSDASGADTNEKGVSQDMYVFMQEFYKAFPALAKNPLFVFGESYGGHYAPATAHRIWMNNKVPGANKIPLVGLATGNGLTAPDIQYQYYAELAYQWCTVKLGKPCVSKDVYESMVNGIPSCVAVIKSCMASNFVACAEARLICNSAMLLPFQDTGRNVYDISKECHGPLCYDFSKVTAFMNRADVQKSLGVKQQIWHSCNMQVNRQFTNDWFQSFDGYVAEMLNSGDVRVLVYAGDLDFICNWLGNQAWTQQMEWAGKASYLAAPVLPYKMNGKTVATTQSTNMAGDSPVFTFARIFEAGHMAPMDQPEVMLAIVLKFITGLQW